MKDEILDESTVGHPPLGDFSKESMSKKSEVNTPESSSVDSEKYPEFDKGMGTFCRVICTKRSSGSVLTCTCDDYMRTGTCRETRFFGLLKGMKVPGSDCTGVLFEGWCKIRSGLMQQWDAATEFQQETFNKCFLSETYSDMIKAPPSDPYHG